MNTRILILFNLILSFTSIVHAGCPAMGIRNGNVEIHNCSYSADKPAGASMDVSINYSNESWMADQSAKDMKAKIFQYSEDKDLCKKYVLKKKTYCMDLQQWCVMTGPAPRGARFTVSSFKDGICISKLVRP